MRDNLANSPLFIVGTGRCGSSIVDSLVAMHPDFAWQSSWLSELPDWPSVSLFNRIWDLPGMDRFRDRRFFPKPVEPYGAWRGRCLHFTDESDDPSATEDLALHIAPYIERVRRFHGRPRFLGKLVGRPVKIEQLAAVYPRAVFLHVTRDLKPTLASLMRVEFYQDWEPFSAWPSGEIDARCLEYAEACGDETIDTALRLKLNRDEVDRQLARIDPARYACTDYPVFCDDPVAELRRVGAVLGFEVDAALEKRLRTREVYGGADDKWRSFFTPEQVARLDEFVQRFGYGLP
jgi:hypothetical protein